MGTNAAVMGGDGESNAGAGRNVWVRGRDGDKKLSPCHSLIVSLIIVLSAVDFLHT